MSLSFEDSLKNSMAKVASASIEQEFAIANMNVDVNNMEVENYSIMTLDESNGIAAYAGDGGSWQQHRDYVVYNVFSDEDISTISDNKDILLNRKQFNITQEENSQYIPFEMPRYYDGFDLVNTVISIHYETSSKLHGSSKPVNVTFNDEKIRFGWLVDAGATLDAGVLKFEIHAYGTVTGNDGVSKSYVWKSKSDSSLTVLQSLCDCEDVVNEIDSSWVQELITDVAEKIADEIKDVAIGEQVSKAEAAAQAAQDAQAEAEKAAENASSAASDAVNSVLEGYATTKYVDDAIASVDVSEQLNDYVKTSDLEENYYTKTDTEQRVSSALENYATKDDVADAITSADISEKLNDYYTKSETYNKSEVDVALGNVKVDLTGYATEKFVTDKTDVLASSVAANTSSVSSINKSIEDINQTIANIDDSPRVTYEATYGNVEMEDGTTQEYMFTLWETEEKTTLL